MKKRLFLPEKWAYQYFENLFKNQTKIPQTQDLQTEKIRNLRQKCLYYAGFLGASGILLLYLPYWFFPRLFLHFYVDLPYFPHIQIPYIYMLYGGFLAVLEIVLLVRLNLYMVFHLAQICNSNIKDVTEDAQVREFEMLFAVGMEKSATQLLNFGIDPQKGLSQWQITLFSTLNMFKATLSNVFIKMVLSRIFWRLTLRFAFLKYLIDLISLPIFAFWDIYATNRVFMEARIRLFAPKKIQDFIQEIPVEVHKNKATKEILLDILQYVAVAKRSFHQNHYLLAEAIVTHFGLSSNARPTYNTEEDILQKIKSIVPEARQFLAKLLLLGLIIDGQASYRDYRVLQHFANYDNGYFKNEFPFLIMSWKEFKKTEKFYLVK